MTTEANGPAPTDDEVSHAMDVLRRAAVGQPPVILVEFGDGFEDKFLFCRLDWIRTSAGALGYDTATMRNHGATP